MQLRLTVSVCLLAVLTLSGAAFADVALSKANRPAADASEVNPEGFLEYSLIPVPRPEVIASTPTRPAQRPLLRYNQDFLRSQPNASGDEEWYCLAEALYFEARGESIKGQFAVAEVIMNRVASKRFPDSVCGVVEQGTGKQYQCQFSYNCDGAAEVVNERRAWARVGKVARLMLDGAPRQLTAGATYYHTNAVSPRWSEKFARTATIGTHHFYRQPALTASNG